MKWSVVFFGYAFIGTLLGFAVTFGAPLKNPDEFDRMQIASILAAGVAIYLRMGEHE